MAGLSRENAVAEYHISAPLTGFIHAPKGLLLRRPHTHTHTSSSYIYALGTRFSPEEKEVGQTTRTRKMASKRIQMSVIKHIVTGSLKRE